MAWWKDWELDYLHDHAGDGAESIANRLGRSRRSVEVMASRERVSLRKSWFCPHCCRAVYRPLTDWSGWCRRCTVEASREAAANINSRVRDELRKEEAAVRDIERSRQAIYSDTNKKRSRLRNLRESRELNEKSLDRKETKSDSE